jgi:hypothetical protein
MQLIAAAEVPHHLETKADFTIKQLKPANGPKIRRIRKRYYNDFTFQSADWSGRPVFCP